MCRFGAIISWLALAYASRRHGPKSGHEIAEIIAVQTVTAKPSANRIESNRFFGSLECQQNFADNDLVNCLDLVRIADYMHMHMDMHMDTDSGSRGYNYSGHTWTNGGQVSPLCGILNNSGDLT